MSAPAQTILIVIGNSDDKLTQQRWADFIRDVEELIIGLESYAGVTVHGRWHAYPGTQWQNASWLLQVDGAMLPHTEDLRDDLRILCARYEQDSIAWVTGETEFIQSVAE
jgi:hypothetical protein